METNKGSEEVRYLISAKDHMVRRAIHLASSLVIIFYLFPPTFLLLPSKLWLIILLGMVPLLIEIYRIKKGMALPGQREHEKGTIGSYAWALWTSAAIMLVLPQQIGLPVIVIYTLADPVIGEVRLWKKWLVFPIGALFAMVMFLVFGYSLSLAIFASVFMILGEALEIKGKIGLRPELFRMYRNRNFNENIVVPFKTDDNATTQLVPAIALGLVYIFYPSWFPGPWLYPLI
ncbi:MAG: hypothetical protein R6V01_00510 [Thermoplasmatota archaeon]